MELPTKLLQFRAVCDLSAISIERMKIPTRSYRWFEYSGLGSLDGNVRHVHSVELLQKQERVTDTSTVSSTSSAGILTCRRALARYGREWRWRRTASP